MRQRFVVSALSSVLFAAPVFAAGPAVTVYSRDLAYVQESRTLTVQGARDTLRLSDVPDRIDFSSVRLDAGRDVRVTRLAYRYDVANGDGLIERSIGSRVRVNSRGDRVTEGTLVTADGSWLVLRTDDGAMVNLSRMAVEELRLANPPKNLMLRPTLEAVLEGGKASSVDASLSYLTGGMSWDAEHQLERTGETSGVWSTRVTIENSSGRDYRDATLKLVAGDPRRVPSSPGPRPAAMRTMALDGMVQAKADLSEQGFSEYHLYTLDRPALLRDKETQSLVMLTPRTVKLTPRYFYSTGMAGVLAQVEIVNTKDGGLGVPLPGGRVRIFQRDAGNTQQFAGESQMKHTAEGEKAMLDIGTAFDIAVERRELANKRISDREREVEVEVELRNRKSIAVKVVVEESVGGDNEVLQKTHEYTRKDANTLRFEIPVAAGKTSVLRYTVRMRY